MSARPAPLSLDACDEAGAPLSDFEALKSLLAGEVHTVVERLAADRHALARLVQEHRIFKEAIEKSPVAYCVYDADDRLIASNAAYGRLHPALSVLGRDTRGVRSVFYSDLLREQLRSQVPAERLEQAIAERVHAQRSADGTPVVRHYGEHGYYRLTKYPLSGGAVAGLAFDVTELKARESELTQAKADADEATGRAQAALAQERLRKHEARLLSELGEWLQSCKTLVELYQVIGRYMAQIFPGTSGELYIYSNSRDVLDGVCAWRREQQMVEHFQPDECWALRRGRIYKYGVGLIRFPCGHAHDVDPDDTSAAYLCLPIIAHGDTVGLLHIRFAERGPDAGDALLRADVNAFAIQCSEHISLAIANVKLRDELRDQSTRDPLTGLYNRRFFFERCRHELNRATRSGEAVGVISLDADNFKRFNDQHGHDAGDTVLRSIGELLSSSVVGGEVVARLGGEEFAMLLPEGNAAQTRARADDIRQRIESLVIRYRDIELPRITVSAGVACFPEGGSTTQELLRAADAALYAAKDAGRNRVCSAPRGAG